MFSKINSIISSHVLTEWVILHKDDAKQIGEATVDSAVVLQQRTPRSILTLNQFEIVFGEKLL